MRGQPGRMKVPGAGPHPKGPETDDEGADPPPEDHGNAGRAHRAVISWMRWPTMWPQGGSETSPTSSAAAGQARWVPWNEMNGTQPLTSFWP